MRLLFEALILPPASLLLLAAIGAMAWRANRRLGQVLVGLSLLSFYVLSLPITGKLLLRAVSLPNLVPSDAQAIVVLSANLRDGAAEFGGAAPDMLTLERLRYAAFLERMTLLPVLVSGGTLQGNKANLARVMADTLNSDYGVRARWLEDRSLTTAENAKFSAAILRANGINRIYLVSHSWHLARAKLAFERVGLKVYPAGTDFPAIKSQNLYDPIPTIKGLSDSYYGLHELLGYVWYSLTFRTSMGESR